MMRNRSLHVTAVHRWTRKPVSDGMLYAKVSTAVAQEIEKCLAPPTLSERRFIATYFHLSPPTSIARRVGAGEHSQLTPKIATSWARRIYQVECKANGVYVFVFKRFKRYGCRKPEYPKNVDLFQSHFAE